MTHTPRIGDILHSRLSVLVAVLLCAQLISASPARAAGEDPSLAVLMAPRPVAVERSPDGAHLAVVMRDEALLRLLTVDTDAPQARTVVLPADGHLHTLRWLDAQRVLLLWQGDTEVTLFELRLSDSHQTIGPLVRLAGLKSETRDQLRLVSAGDDRLWLSLDARRNGRPDLHELDLETGQLSFERRNPGKLFRWFHHPPSGMLLGWFWQRASDGPAYQLRFLASGQSTWSTLTGHGLLEPAITVLGFSDAGSSIDTVSETAADDPAGERWRVTRWSLDGLNSSSELMQLGGAPRQLIWDRGRLNTEYREAEHLPLASRSEVPGWQARLDRLSQLAPQADPVWQGGRLSDRFSLWRLDFEDQPARWRIEDDQGNRARWLFEADPLHHARYTHQRQLIRARDGLELEAFLALPGPIDQPAPTVLLVHGGPWARDRAVYRDDLELLTAQGFAVLRVNYRGSRGNGHALFEAGVGEWGEGMREDLEDALAAVVASGQVDPDRVCIMGHSYGGFAALNAVMRDQHPYRCAVAFAPVSDVAEQIRQYQSRRHARAYLEWQTMVGLPARLSALQSISPMQRLDLLDTPVLIAHGTDDRRVLPAQSRQLVQSLEQREKSALWLELEGADHHLTDRHNRLHYYRQAITFLRSHLLDRPMNSEQSETDGRSPARNSTP